MAVSGAKAWRRVEIVFGDRELSSVLYAVSEEAPARVQDVDALLSAFVDRRRAGDDVYWLKENAELLRLLVVTDTAVDCDALAHYETFHSTCASRLQFFPQYYRFILSIIRDLELLGYGQRLFERLADHVRQQNLMSGELSDLQRLEADWLLESRHDSALCERIAAFCGNAAFFAVPNRKAAFELTHAVFYASRYGAVEPTWLGDVSTSLYNAGMVALLDNDMDLLAEVAVALQFSGSEPPFYWQQVLCSAHEKIQAEPTGRCVPGTDYYHEALTLGWAATLSGRALFANGFAASDCVFARQERARQPSPLRELSQALWQSGDGRSASWEHFLAGGGQQLSDRTRASVHALDASCAEFPGFFQAFSRSVSVLAHA